MKRENQCTSDSYYWCLKAHLAQLSHCCVAIFDWHQTVYKHDVKAFLHHNVNGLLMLGNDISFKKLA